MIWCLLRTFDLALTGSLLQLLHMTWTYLLETSDNQIWRYQVDHVKERVLSVVQPSVIGSTWDHTHLVSGVMEPTPATVPAAHTTTPVLYKRILLRLQQAVIQSRRYPTREHHAPNYYRPSVISCRVGSICSYSQVMCKPFL